MELLKFSSLLPFQLGKKSVNHKDYYQLNHLRQYANVFYYKKHLGFATNNIVQSNQITFNSLFPYANVRKLKKRYGKPLYHVDHYHGENHIEILYFKRMISDQKVRLEYHFCEGQLFYYNYTFPYLVKHEKDNLFKNIEEKYNLIYKDIIDNCIVDENSIAMSASDRLDLKIAYLNTKSKFFKYLNNRFDKNKNTGSAKGTSKFSQIYNLL